MRAEAEVVGVAPEIIFVSVVPLAESSVGVGCRLDGIRSAWTEFTADLGAGALFLRRPWMLSACRSAPAGPKRRNRIMTIIGEISPTANLAIFVCRFFSAVWLIRV